MATAIVDQSQAVPIGCCADTDQSMLNDESVVCTNVDKKDYIRFGSGRSATTILTNYGREMTVIDDQPRRLRRVAPPSHAHKGSRYLHRTTLSLATLGPEDLASARVFSSSYSDDFSGGNKRHEPSRPSSCPSQHREHFSIGVGDRTRFETTHTSHYPTPSSLVPRCPATHGADEQRPAKPGLEPESGAIIKRLPKENITFAHPTVRKPPNEVLTPKSLQEKALVNRAFQMTGMSMRQAVNRNKDFTNWKSTYVSDVLPTANQRQTQSGTIAKSPLQPSIKKSTHNPVTWEIQKPAPDSVTSDPVKVADCDLITWQPKKRQDSLPNYSARFHRISGNRILLPLRRADTVLLW